MSPQITFRKHNNHPSVARLTFSFASSAPEEEGEGRIYGGGCVFF